MIKKNLFMPREENESGFTLIEILVVILIIGILASIAIPVFLNQRKTANDSATRSDLRNIAIAIETHFAKNPNDIDVDFVNDIPDFRPSKDVQMAIRGNANTWCAVAVHSNGNFNSTANVAKALTYDSTNGGMMPNGWDWHAKSKCETADTVWSWKTGV
jgi:type IV pilus assembly protein PilA